MRKSLLASAALLCSFPALAWPPHGSGSSGNQHVAIAAGTAVAYLQSSNNTGNLSGDTWIWTAWAPASAGGGVFGQMNDPVVNALGVTCSSAPTVCGPVALTINAASPTANTTNITLAGGVNPLSGYSAAAQSDCGTANWKSYGSWYRGGILYRNVYRQQSSGLFPACASTIIMSPDNGAHNCNPATYASSGNTCTSSNWSATGDTPGTINSSTMLWIGSGVNDNTHPMSNVTPIQSYQDGATCVSIPGDDSCTYDLFYNQDGQRTNIYFARILKSASPMVLSNWQYWQGGDVTNDANWSTTLATSAVVTTQAAFGYLPTAVWLPNFSRVLLCGSNDGSVAIVCMSGPNPGALTSSIITLTSMKCPAPNATVTAYGFPTLILGTMSYSAPTYSIILGSGGTFVYESATQSQNCYSPFFTPLTLTLQ